MKRIPVDYTIKDPLRIKRWMCGKCGLIFDYQFDPLAPGWPEIDPSFGFWQDENGKYQYSESDEVHEHCPRCNADFNKLALIPIVIGKFNFGSYLKTTFVVEDDAHEKIVLEIAKCFQKDIEIAQAGNSSNVKSLFQVARSQGELDFVYFLVDGDNQRPDKELINEVHFFHLEKYCIENYLLDFEVCALISGKSKNTVKQVLLEAIQSKSRDLLNSKLGEALIRRLAVSDIKPTLLSDMDASKFTEEFIRKLGFSNKNRFLEKYVKYCHQTSRLARVFPATLVKAIKKSKIKPLPKE